MTISHRWLLNIYKWHGVDDRYCYESGKGRSAGPANAEADPLQCSSLLVKALKTGEHPSLGTRKGNSEHTSRCISMRPRGYSCRHPLHPE
jgi:hypothetical protein